MSYSTADRPPTPSSLDGQPLDDDDDVDDSACAVYGSSTSKNVRDQYYSKRYSRRSRSSDEHYTGRISRSESRSPSRSRDRYSKRRRRDRSREYRHRRSRSRSRSSSRRRHYERKHRRDDRKSRRSRSRSRSRHSRSRSRSRRSRSRSRDYYSRCRRSRSRCCRYNGSCSCSSSSSPYSDRESSSLYRSQGRKYVREVPKDQDYIRKVYAKHDDDEPVQENTFKNDGSFLEMFKKMQEQKAAEEKKEEPVQPTVTEVKKSIPIFGKRRGGRILKTGLVQKIKTTTEVEEEPKDAWSVYMKEVKRYKEACCDDDSKTRPLVK